ncbi:alpha-glucan family phosphorylase [Luteolibacter ambystomatis]|uniref:Alpha-glucan family phosphorylase n=1 Tax=Luteolibacter ambystomatis TaxID=2824561 RepID=A0A975IYR1_9BACT|nr:alpha-glucan family phosphorylase [Luteolibacter ambystomatis]QUE50492.1 alpha-glucan family phosphorylase [Luteolibacter ambystomatis]
MSFLPKPFAHPYEIAPEFSKSAVYFSCEFALDQSFKIYSGGLGFLAGSHMKSAAAQRQNLCGVGIYWSYGYYNQTRGDEGEMAVQFRKNEYAFLRDTGIRFTVPIHGHPVWVKALYLPAETFSTVPMFFLSTDLEENDPLSRAITHRLYDNDPLRRIAQYTILGAGGARLMEELGVDPEVWHLNEAHGLSAAFRLYEKHRDVEEVRKRLVFTTHTPEEAGNEKHDFKLLKDFSFFGSVPEEEVREITGIEGEVFNHSLAALRLAHIANGVSKLHGEVSRQMWKGHAGICPITHVTNAQNKKYWADHGLEAARVHGDTELLRNRKRELKERLFRVVADQTGKIFRPDVLTIVWARRFAGYKRPDLITRDMRLFRELLSNSEHPVQVIWAGKPFPFDFGAIETFNKLVGLCRHHPNAAVLVGYELELSRFLKNGADIWLNNPVVTREASGTSGMTAAMNGALNLSTYDGWVCEFADFSGANSFIIPPADPSLSPESRDRHDLLGFYEQMEKNVLPLYYENPQGWAEKMLRSMNDVVPFFDSDRMAAEYYTKIYAHAAQPVIDQTPAHSVL